jgi:hypothetical protein
MLLINKLRLKCPLIFIRLCVIENLILTLQHNSTAMNTIQRKKLPYGTSNFEKLITQGYYFG